VNFIASLVSLMLWSASFRLSQTARVNLWRAWRSLNLKSVGKWPVVASTMPEGHRLTVSHEDGPVS
jgi:hypothetical protein